MSFEVLMCLIVVGFVVISMLLVPFLKKKGLWAVTLFAVNLIEQVCDFMELHGYGPKKYEFVKKVLLMISPHLMDEQIDLLIETIVDKMHQLGGMKQ